MILVEIIDVLTRQTVWSGYMATVPANGDAFQLSSVDTEGEGRTSRLFAVQSRFFDARAELTEANRMVSIRAIEIDPRTGKPLEPIIKTASNILSSKPN